MIMYEANCQDGIVYMLDDMKKIPVPDCEVLGAGGNSFGIIIADAERFWYVPLSTPDLIKSLNKMQEICGKLVKICENLDNCKTLIDNASTAAGIAAFVPSVATGTAIATKAELLKTEIEQLDKDIANIKDNLA